MQAPDPQIQHQAQAAAARSTVAGRAAPGPGGRSRSWPGLLLAAAISLLRETHLRAEDHLDYKFEYYAEQGDRIQVRTYSALFETELTPQVFLKGSAVYDGISGATPDGGPPLAGSTRVRTVGIRDVRYAGSLEPNFRLGQHTFKPQLTYSIENDYESLAPALNYVYDFNRRNTSLNLGVAQNIDRNIRGIYVRQPQRKDSTDFLAGVTQALGPSSLLNVTFTLGTASGYLSDPYKGFRFSNYPNPSALFPERRPGHRTKQIISSSLTQFVEPLKGSAELTYRFYHDSFGLFGHTATLEWFQRLGKHVVISPLVRYYEQSAADFYRLSFMADPSDPNDPGNALIPKFYSSDYRLSRLRTWTYGAGATARLGRWLFLDAAYKRYEMSGLDGATSASNFSNANIYTLGLRLHF